MTDSAIQVANTVLTRDNITFALALLGSLGALTSWSLVFVSQRKKIRISPLGFRSNSKGCFFLMMFENQSRLPISITRITLIDGENKFDCAPTPKVVIQKTRSHATEMVYRSSDYSLSMPISIPSLGATSGYILFECDQPLLEGSATSAVFEVYTTRGKLKRISLSLSGVPHLESPPL